MLLDLLDRPGRCRQLTARFDGEVAGGALLIPAALTRRRRRRFLFRDFRLGATMELGRSGRPGWAETTECGSGRKQRLRLERDRPQAGRHLSAHRRRNDRRYLQRAARPSLRVGPHC